MSQIFLSKEKMHLLELPEIPTPYDFHFLVLYRMHNILSFAGNIRLVICIIRGICQNCRKWTVAPPSRSKKLNFSLSITSTKTSRKEKPDKDSLFFAVSCCEIFGSFILVRIKSFYWLTLCSELQLWSLSYCSACWGSIRRVLFLGVLCLKLHARSRKRWDLNPELLIVEREHYLWAMPPLIIILL